MKIEDIRLAKGALNDAIYAGKLNAKGDAWLQKVDVTNDFIAAVIDRWCGYKETIIDGNGHKYEITVKRIKEMPPEEG